MKTPDFESIPLSPEVQEIHRLISEGRLPPADQFSSKDGAPTWSLCAIAKILGVSTRELIEHLENAGDRFGLCEQLSRI